MTEAPTADLIARLEAAKAEDQTDVVRDALRFSLDQGWITADAYRRAYEMCNAGAFVDAALVMVPEGWSATMSAHHRNIGTFARVFNNGLVSEPAAVCHRNGPLSLALTIAILKAREITNG